MTGRLRGGARGATQGQGAGCAQAVRPAESVAGLWGGGGTHRGTALPAALGPRGDAHPLRWLQTRAGSGARGAGGEAGRGERWREVGVPGRGWGGHSAPRGPRASPSSESSDPFSP